MAEGASRAIEHELLFCLLGGFGISYELAHSASQRLRMMNLFEQRLSGRALEAAIHVELATAQFEPLRLDGSMRRHRFPARKARIIAQAIDWVRSSDASLVEQLRNAFGRDEQRRLLCRCPGVGLKTASWIVRNCGLADDVAVIDVHVLRALSRWRGLNDLRMPTDYLSAEAEFLAWAAEAGAPPAAFDLFIWELSRAR